MKNLNANIIGVGCYHPTREYTNDYFIEHFKNTDVDIVKLLIAFGRKTSYRIDNDDENSLTMAYNASKEAIENAGISPDMIDMLIFVSSSPEYFAPTNALKLNHMLNAKNAHLLFDMNNNCAGVVTAMDMVSRYMQSNPAIRYALIVGVLHISNYALETDPIYYSIVGDGSGAIVIENKEEDIKRGFIGSAHVSNAEYHWSVAIPKCGMSKIFREDIPTCEKKGHVVPAPVNAPLEEWPKVINMILTQNNLKMDDIDHFIFSQFSISALKQTLEIINVPFDKATYIGDKIGYTGESSPIFALKEALAQGKIKEGSKVIFITVGGGYSVSACLFYF